MSTLKRRGPHRPNMASPVEVESRRRMQEQQRVARRALGHTRADLIWHLLKEHGINNDRKPWPPHRVLATMHDEAHRKER